MAWQTKKLGEVCEVVGGGTPSTTNSTYWGEDYYFVTPKDLGRLLPVEISQTERKISKKGLINSSAKLLPTGTVIMSSRAPIGYVAINSIETVTNQGCRSFICSKKIYNRFLYYFLKNSTYLLYSFAGGSTFAEISGSRLKEIQIQLPPVEEQVRIVKKIEELFRKIDEAKKLREEAQKDSAAIVSSALHQIFSQGREKGWEYVQVGDICDIKGGKRLPGGHKLLNYRTNHPYLRVADFIPYGIEESEIKYISDETFQEISRYTINSNEVFISIAGTVGLTGIIPEHLNDANLTENAAKLTNLKNVHKKYLMYILCSNQVQDQIKTDAIQTTIFKLGLFRIARLKIPLPPIEDQKKIVIYLDSLSEKVKSLQKMQAETAADLAALRQSILHKAFQGELL